MEGIRGIIPRTYGSGWLFVGELKRNIRKCRVFPISLALDSDLAFTDIAVAIFGRLVFRLDVSITIRCV